MDDQDSLDAALAECEASLTVGLFDWRLSSTYDAAVQRRRYHASILGPRREVDVVRERPRLRASGAAYTPAAAILKALTAFREAHEG